MINAVRDRPVESVLIASNHLTDEQTTAKLLALPSKKQLALEWLLEYPEDVVLACRELENHRQPQGVIISRDTWAKAQKEARLVLAKDSPTQ